MEHMLKLNYAPPLIHKNNQRGWRNTIHVQRRDLRNLLKDSPSAARDHDEAWCDAWTDALATVREECDDFGPVEWPTTCPWPIEDVLGELS